LAFAAFFTRDLKKGKKMIMGKVCLSSVQFLDSWVLSLGLFSSSDPDPVPEFFSENFGRETKTFGKKTLVSEKSKVFRKISAFFPKVYKFFRKSKKLSESFKGFLP